MKSVSTTALAALLLLASFICAAQVPVKAVGRQLNERATQRLIAKPDNPVITSPSAGSTIAPGENFHVAGTALAQAQVTVRIMPISKGQQTSSTRSALIRMNDPHFEPQDFTLTADRFGKWRTPAIQVKFRDGSTDRKVHIFVAQSVEGVASTGKVHEFALKATGPVFIAQQVSMGPSDAKLLEAFTITGPIRLLGTGPDALSLPTLRNSEFRIQGTAHADTRVVVEVRFAGRTVKKRNSLRTTLGVPHNHVDEKITNHSNKLFGRWELAPDANGQWQTPSPQIAPYTQTVVATHKVAGFTTVRDTDEVIMERITVVARLMRGERQLSEKTLTLMPVL